jgi:anaerobic nitric oxide reductase transcription regulator
VVAATNVDLAEAVDAGEFRADLYARLLGAVISVPPLRARREDILVLTRHFLGRADADVRVDIDAAEALAIHAWPFNVRELEQIIVAAAPRARVAGRLELDHLPPPLPLPIEERATGHGPAQAHGRVASADADALIALRVRRDGVPTRAELETVLRHFTGNIAQVAAYFSRDRKQIYRWAGRLGVDLDAHRRGDAEPD